MKYFLQGSISVFICVITLYHLFGFAECRRHCFSCSTKESGPTCLHNPENVTEGHATVPCKYYCTIWREEYLYIPESMSLISFNRSCEKNPIHNNSVVMDNYFITYYRACRSHLCNFGDGRESLSHLPDDGEEDDELMVVHSASVSVYSSSFSRFPNSMFLAWICFCFTSLGSLFCIYKV